MKDFDDLISGFVSLSDGSPFAGKLGRATCSIPPIIASAVGRRALGSLGIVGVPRHTALSAPSLAAEAVCHSSTFFTPVVLLDRSRLARACGARRLRAFGDRPAPLAISAVLAAVEHVEAATGATVVPFLFFRRRSAAAHRLGALPLLGRVSGPAPSAVVTAVADAFLVALALLLAVLVAVWGPLLRQGAASLVGRLPLVRVVSRV